MDKECVKCNIVKPINKFRIKERNGETIKRHNECNDCNNVYKKENYHKTKKENPEKYQKMLYDRKVIDHNRYIKKKNEIREKQNNYYEKNKEKIQQKRKEYRKNNPEKVKTWKNSYRDSLEGKISMNLRRRVRTEIGSGKEWLQLLGCTFDHLKSWFEFNFELDQNKNFNWDNYGKIWTIDHVKPCKSFNMNNSQETQKCFNWKNTLPVSKKYNQEKSGKLLYGDIIKINERIILFEKMNRLKFELPSYISNCIKRMVKIPFDGNNVQT